jgi:inositol monophosphatase 3
MWPYTIRLNPAGFLTIVLVCVGLYLLYAVSTPSPSRHFKEDPLAARHRDETQPLFADTINLKKLLIAGIKATEAGGLEVVNVRKSANLGERSKGETREGAKEMVTKGDIRSHWAMVNGLSATFTGLQIISEENHQAADEEGTVDQLDIKPFHQKDLIGRSNDLKVLPHDIDVPLNDVMVWIDPLDATQEYQEQDESLLKYVTTMMCVALSGKPIIGIIHVPFENKTYWGWAGKGVSLTVKEIERSKIIENRSDTIAIVSRSHSGPVDQFLKTTLGQDIQIVHAGGAGYKSLEVMKGNADAYIHRTLIKKWDICAPNALLDAFGGKMTTLNGHSISYAFQENSEKNEDGVLAAASYSDHEDFLSKLKSTL